MPLHRSKPSILMFDHGTAILPSRPTYPPPSRVAAVKTGRRPPRPWRGLVLTAASTMAPERMPPRNIFPIMGASSWVF